MNTRNLVSTALGALVFGCAATAQPALPSAFKSRTVSSPDGASIFVRSAGSGPVVVLLHGYAETSDSWAPLATEMIKSYTVVVPDLRGIGKSSHPPGGYDKKTQRRISGLWSRRSGLIGRLSFRTTSASWWLTLMRPVIRTKSNGSLSWMPRSQE